MGLVQNDQTARIIYAKGIGELQGDRTRGPAFEGQRFDRRAADDSQPVSKNIGRHVRVVEQKLVVL
jgi:hypothetical protein